MRQVSMATRDELLAALTVRFGQAVREDKVRILTEFVALTGYHRKHAARLLRGGGGGIGLRPVRGAGFMTTRSARS